MIRRLAGLLGFVLAVAGLLFVSRSLQTPPLERLESALLQDPQQPGPLSEALSDVLGGSWNVTQVAGAAGERFRVDRGLLPGLRGRHVPLWGTISLSQKGNDRVAWLFVHPVDANPNETNVIDRHQVELARLLLTSATPESVLALLWKTPSLPSALERELPPWRFPSRHEPGRPLVFETASEPAAVGLAGYRLVVFQRGDASRDALDALATNLLDAAARGSLVNPPPTPKTQTASRHAEAFRSDRPLVTGEVPISLALEQYRLEARAAGGFTDVAFPRPRTSGLSSGIVSRRERRPQGSPPTLLVTLKVLPEGALVRAELPLDGRDAELLERLPSSRPTRRPPGLASSSGAAVSSALTRTRSWGWSSRSRSSRSSGGRKAPRSSVPGRPALPNQRRRSRPRRPRPRLARTPGP